MVLFVIDDLESSVYLLKQYHSHELVGEGEIGEGKPHISCFPHSVVETV